MKEIEKLFKVYINKKKIHYIKKIKKNSCNIINYI